MAGVCQPKVKHLGFGYWFDGIDWPKKLSSETLAGLFQCWPAVKTLEIYHRPFLQPLSVVIEENKEPWCDEGIPSYLAEEIVECACMAYRSSGQWPVT
jgi:hypothetical protein